MSFASEMFGTELFITKPVAGVEKAAGVKVKVEKPKVVAIGVILCVLVGLAVLLYAINQADAGRLVIDLAVAFLGFVSGRGLGEAAGLKRAGRG
jgi:hypothetical protein